VTGPLSLDEQKPAANAHRLIMRGGGSAAAGYVIRFGARLLFLLLAARLFGAALFGAYSLAIAAVELAVAASGLGMKRFLFPLLEGRGDRRACHVLLDAALLATGASLILTGLFVLAALSLPPNLLAPNTALAILIVAPMIAGQALLDIFGAATRWHQKMRHEVIARSLVEPYAGIAAAAAAYGAGFDQTGLLISYWAGTLSALFYVVAAARRSFGGFGLRHYRPHFARLATMLRASALPASTDIVGAWFARLDLYLVGIFLGEAPAGIYGMARQIRTPIRQVRQSLDGMLTPIVARTLSVRGARDTFAATASATRMMLAIQLPILFMLIALGEPMLGWLGPEFVAGYWALVILGAAETILSAFGIGDLILLYRRPALGHALTVASMLVNVAVAWPLIAAWGLEGAALALLVAVTSGALARRLVVARSFGIVLPAAHSAGPVLAFAAACLVVPLAWLAPAIGSLEARALVIMAVGLAVYFVMLRLWLALTGESLALVNLEAEAATQPA
jgi:O-antigen/teichoic acid export membrane protein